ncbi:MAG: LIC20211 family lipoprotein [Leptospira bouyouniensis]
MKKNVSLIFLFVLSMFVSNCASSSVGIATSNKPIPNTPYETIKTVDKTFTWYAFDIVLFGVPISQPPVADLYEKVLEEESGDALVNIRYWNDKSIFGPITRYRFNIKGDLVKFQNSQTQTKSKK